MPLTTKSNIEQAVTDNQSIFLYFCMPLRFKTHTMYTFDKESISITFRRSVYVHCVYINSLSSPHHLNFNVRKQSSRSPTFRHFFYIFYICLLINHKHTMYNIDTKAFLRSVVISVHVSVIKCFLHSFASS